MTILSLISGPLVSILSIKAHQLTYPCHISHDYYQLAMVCSAVMFICLSGSLLWEIYKVLKTGQTKD